jgi:kynurenine formamidase
MEFPSPPPAPSADQVEAYFAETRNWGRWGDDDQRGALNLLTADRQAAGAALVTSGRAVSLGHDLPVAPSLETPAPAHHHMLASGDARDANGIPGYEASRDYVGTDVHGMGITHIDALCHMFIRGEMYNGRSASEVKSTGSESNTIMAAAEGLSGRGVYLDVPKAFDRPHLPGNTALGVAHLEAAEAALGVRVGEGDILVVGTGRDARKAETGRLDPFRDGLAGLHAECLPWLHDRGVAVLGSDGISDPTPGLGIPDWPFPIHQVGIVGIGLHLIDNLALLDLSAACAEVGRWEFFVTLAPLRVVGGTGCPVNPIAIL